MIKNLKTTLLIRHVAVDIFHIFYETIKLRMIMIWIYQVKKKNFRLGIWDKVKFTPANFYTRLFLSTWSVGNVENVGKAWETHRYRRLLATWTDDRSRVPFFSIFFSACFCKCFYIFTVRRVEQCKSIFCCFCFFLFFFFCCLLPHTNTHTLLSLAPRSLSLSPTSALPLALVQPAVYWR